MKTLTSALALTLAGALLAGPVLAQSGGGTSHTGARTSPCDSRSARMLRTVAELTSTPGCAASLRDGTGVPSEM